MDYKNTYMTFGSDVKCAWRSLSLKEMAKVYDNVGYAVKSNGRKVKLAGIGICNGFPVALFDHLSMFDLKYVKANDQGLCVTDDHVASNFDLGAGKDLIDAIKHYNAEKREMISASCGGFNHQITSVVLFN